MSLAQDALSRARSLGLPADPQTFEILYLYVSGTNPELNEQLNSILQTRGSISVEDLDRLHEQFIAANKPAERVTDASTRIAGEVDQILAMLSAAAGVTAEYRDNLAEASQNLSNSFDLDSVRAIVEGVVEFTKGIEEQNRALEGALKKSTREITLMQERLDIVRIESLTDPLTGIANRKQFDQSLERAFAAARSDGKPLSLLFLDIDHFKKFNDQHGHQTGDHVLRLVAQVLRGSIRAQDVAARYGGEEFALVLPGATQTESLRVAESVRAAVKQRELIRRSTNQSLGRVTVSVGIATLDQADDIASLMERADQCLYAAKRQGRDCAIVESNLHITQSLTAP
jgi:diguanylate cyclase